MGTRDALSASRLVVWHRWLPPREAADTPTAEVRDWLRALPGRVRVMGGDIVGTLGAALAASFECSEACDVVEMSLELLDEADTRGLAVSIAVTAGPLPCEEAPVVSAALERAQLLANRTRPGEVVLDSAARELVRDAFLFGRRVNAGPGAPRGITIDRDHARRDDQSARAIREIGPPALPATLRGVVDETRDALDAGHLTLAFRGPVGAGASEVIAAMLRERGGTPWRLEPALGGLVPLGSLRAALRRRYVTPEAVADAFASVDPSGVLRRVADGELVPRAALVAVLKAFLDEQQRTGASPWLIMSPVGQIDGATLEAVLAAHQGSGSVLLARLGLDAELPRPLREARTEPFEIVLPPLKMTDAVTVAQGALGEDTAPDVVRRVAVLGGDTVLGILDVARALMASGDLVRTESGFGWRKNPVEGAAALDADAMLDARIAPLAAETSRSLEAVCVLPEGSPRELVERVAAQHGVAKASFQSSLATLVETALARDTAHPRPSSPRVRWRVLARMSETARQALHGRVASVLAASEARSAGGPARPVDAIQQAYHLKAAGRDEEARGRVDDAVAELVAAGYQRAARQLIGWLETWQTLAASEFDEEGPPTREIPLAPIAGEELEGPEDATSIGTLLAPSEVPDPSLELEEEPTRIASMSHPALRRALTSGPEATAVGTPAPQLAPQWQDDTDRGAAPVSRPPPLPRKLESRPPPLPRAPGPPSGPGHRPRIGSEDGLRGDESIPRIAPESRPPPLPRPPAPLPAESTSPDLLAVPEEDDGKTRVGPLPTLGAGVQQALAARDLHTVESLLTEASGTTAPHRVRALASLLEGDLATARHHLARARTDQVESRNQVTLALIELHAGAPGRGAEASLRALANARRSQDAEGEWVARHVLAECLRAAGFSEDASRAKPE